MTATLDGVSGQQHPPGRALLPGKIRYPLYRRLGGPQGRSGRAENLGPIGSFFFLILSAYILISVYSKCIVLLYQPTSTSGGSLLGSEQ